MAQGFQKKLHGHNLPINNQDSVAGSVIQASGMVVFEDVLRTVAWWPDIQSVTSVCTSPGVNLAPLRGELWTSLLCKQ